MSVRVRRAAPGDTAAITAMIHDLALFERAPDQCTVVETQISSALFGDSTTLKAHVAEVDGEVAAMALWFLNFSTWDGVEGIYLEDLFVRPQFRRLGLARGLLAALATECVDHNYTSAGLGGAELEYRRDRAVSSRRRSTTKRVDHLPGVGFRTGRIGRTCLSLAVGHPAHRGGTEEQRQRGQRQGCHRDPDQRPMRVDRQIPGNR